MDKAEENEEDYNKVNAYGTKYIAEACKYADAKMIYIGIMFLMEKVIIL